MKKKAAVFILLGQSNAVGHNLPMEPEDVIDRPMKNVFGLARTDNQSFDTTELVWSGYTSFGMNLGEEQDNTYSVANCLAADWQAHIDSGNAANLPDLYIVQIAIGAQGTMEGMMWYPRREPKLIPGKLGTADISLFPFSMHILSLLEESLRERGLEPDIIGLHWRGGENDTGRPAEELTARLPGIYREIIGSFNRVLSQPPITLHRLAIGDRMLDVDPTGEKGRLKRLDFVNGVFEQMREEYPNVSTFDVRNAPQYDPDVWGSGLFQSDLLHFTAPVNRWVAEQILEEYVRRKTVG